MFIHDPLRTETVMTYLVSFRHLKFYNGRFCVSSQLSDTSFLVINPLCNLSFLMVGFLLPVSEMTHKNWFHFTRPLLQVLHVLHLGQIGLLFSSFAKATLFPCLIN